MRNRLRHTSEDVARALNIQRNYFLPDGRIPLRWAAQVLDWAHTHLAPAEMKRIKFQVDQT